jgi:hypothetical protein
MNSLRASEPGLILIDQARRQRGWQKQASAWFQAALTSQATLKRFWQREPIHRESFIEICRAVGIHEWQQIAEQTIAEQTIAEQTIAEQTPVLPPQDLRGMPVITTLYGREDLLQQLTSWQTQGGRLLNLWGIGGIGKTAIAAQLTDQIASKFDRVIWRSLRSAPTLLDLLSDILDDRLADVETLLNRLLEQFQKHQTLLVLDGWEIFLGGGAGQYRPDYSDYRKLLPRLAQERHYSCIIITSREKSAELALLEPGQSGVKSIKLEGIGEAATALLSDLLPEPAAWSALIQLYRGNPLALNVIATLIQELFNGRASDFLKANTIVLHQIEPLIADRVRHLNAIERQILVSLSQASKPLNWLVLRQLVGLETAQSDLLEALSALEWRSLIEKVINQEETQFQLQPMVMKYVQKYL